MKIFGPFSVAASQITALGSTYFGSFVNRLLDAEVASHRVHGAVLDFTYRENLADGGVDAIVRLAQPTDWIPSGVSVWQFKAGDLAPAKCKEELAGASFAVSELRAGAKYRLVLGVSLTPEKVARRKAALHEKARELGILIGSDSIEVITADLLAVRAERFPAVSMSPVLRDTAGLGTFGASFERWSSSQRHLAPWVASAERNNDIELIQAFLVDAAQHDFRVEGVSGLGKTRLAMEALRGHELEPLVLYVPAADEISASEFIRWQERGRVAIMVIDECSREEHERFAQTLGQSSRIKLITIGQVGGREIRGEALRISGLDNTAMTDLLRQARTNLWFEVLPVVVELSAGNIDYALKLADAVLSSKPRAAGALVSSEDVKRLVAGSLPGGAVFLACCALALFSRFGFEGDLANELSLIAAGLEIPESELRAAVAAMQELDLISRQGRYRSIGPHPIALYLGARAWENFGSVAKIGGSQR